MGMGMMFFSLLFWLPFIAVPLVISIRALWLALTRPANYRADPACERCRYGIGGLSTFTCPECGTDLRRTGIITPAMEMRRRGSTVGAIAGWTMIMIVVYAVLGGIMASMMVSRMMPAMAGAATMTTSTPLTSTALLYKKLEITNDMGSGFNPAVKSTISIVLTDNAGAVWTMTVDPNTQSCVVSDSAGTVLHTGGMGDEADVTALFDAALIDTTDAKALAEIRELSKIISVTAMTPYANVSNMTLKTFTAGTPTFNSAPTPGAAFATGPGGAGPGGFTPPGMETESIVAMVASVVLFVLWIGGIAYIVVRRKRLARELVKSELPPRSDNAAGPPPTFPAATPG